MGRPERKAKQPKASAVVPLSSTGQTIQDQAVRNLTHELRTALSVIIGFSETMRGELYGPLNNERYKDYAEGIYYSGRHLLDLLNGYTDFTALLEGHLELRDGEANINFSVGRIIRNFTPRAEKNGVRISWQELEEDPVLIIDRVRFKQVISSVLFHAIQRVPNDGEIGVRAKLVDGGLVIKVRHNGAAMTEAEVKNALSQPISTAPNWLYRREESAGLGLYMAKQMTEALGGQFAIAGKPGKGTMVTLSFPPEQVKT